MKILVINPGGTSTKIAVFEEEKEELKVNLDHTAEELAPYKSISDQMPFRKEVILKTLTEKGYKLEDFDAVCGRGGMFKHIPSGTYAVNDAVIQDVLNHPYGEHVANLGPYIAKELADTVSIPSFFVDPVCTDELEDIARYSGMKGFERQSFFHALNQKAVARRASKQIGKSYEELNLIVVHLGGGVSVAAHHKGRVIDVNNVKDEGAMGMDRAGGVPVCQLIDYCFSGVTHKEARKKFGDQGGVFSYTGTKDFRTVENKAFDDNDEVCMGAFKAIAYQLAKDIGAMSAVLRYNVDAIVYTGGMAHSEKFCNEISSYINKIAPIIRIPGEEEMRSLAEGALRALHSGKWETYK